MCHNEWWGGNVGRAEHLSILQVLYNINEIRMQKGTCCKERLAFGFETNCCSRNEKTFEISDSNVASRRFVLRVVRLVIMWARSFPCLPGSPCLSKSVFCFLVLCWCRYHARREENERPEEGPTAHATTRSKYVRGDELEGRGTPARKVAEPRRQPGSPIQFKSHGLKPRGGQPTASYVQDVPMVGVGLCCDYASRLAANARTWS